MTRHHFHVRPIGTVRSALENIHDCPRQESEGAPGAWIEIDPPYAGGLDGLRVGDEIMVFTWLHLSDRSILKVHPRGDPDNPLRGVFATRSPHRPNPIGLHRTRITALEGPTRIRVESLEVIDKTPVVDIKSVLSG
ncbi:MAG: tRNA (N6-threonylcarbamoyladenosine(37)-N6)-methyltransferase TrmO [Deltaproteobacteria bacterium]|nr:tRNA (N6-threonylcarbamoyladenosine(37)-N6)-methyltransferase TrmO [Deltaproteobacteria bacterium]MBW2049096.1 tRNA (N6-threonylcarbamoyladenosine(37)-N6)-methyltransferase TrmO [Deltaproteobacteria bacterium]MBW2113107.1 tRNA (N6-threonylcarbamoyladenosine(37)-N6)-methyltransferase TrmO [Deltaproteobacteria bacterium]MBW2353778.1 tRNA (N6-threonylcarbamoyladenosine(37)-N6)-methyltransferase TrmO [Deltaproteobacteria bacterium]HDZ91379.1 tRNA (N6-threonylcarbamoyladenosine(37)-N6)-methyltran